MRRFVYPLLAFIVLTQQSDAQDAGVGAATPFRCYVGPVRVLVLQPDGKPAAKVEVGVFGASWHAKSADVPAARYKPKWTDVHGEFKMELTQECEGPTIFYARDVRRKLAGFRVVEVLDELAKLQTVQLNPARWVTGEIDSKELSRAGLQLTFCTASLRPTDGRIVAFRRLKYFAPPPQPFRFLVPAGEYRLTLGGTLLEQRLDIPVKVAPGSTALDLGVFDLPMLRRAKMSGRTAPELGVVGWSDGRARSLAELRGNPILLGFWHKGSTPVQSLKRIFALYERVRGSKIQTLLIHAPELRGFDALQEAVSRLEIDGLNLQMRAWPFPVAIDQPTSEKNDEIWRGRTGAAYNVRGFPTFFLIGPDGRVVSTDCLPDFESQCDKLAR